MDPKLVPTKCAQRPCHDGACFRSVRGFTRSGQRGSHRGHDLVCRGPRPAHELGDQPALAGHDRAAVDEDVELADTSLPELDRDVQLFPDARGETRRVVRIRRSGLAIHDRDGHAPDDNALSASEGREDKTEAWRAGGLRDPGDGLRDAQKNPRGWSAGRLVEAGASFSDEDCLRLCRSFYGRGSACRGLPSSGGIRRLRRPAGWTSGRARNGRRPLRADTEA
jgi:hypothetical protein